MSLSAATERMDRMLAPQAVRAAGSLGRQWPEDAAGGGGGGRRSPFQRDRDRIIHAGAFRKLMYKTQVFILSTGDFYRTRLSHSLEVGQIARSIARALALNEDLAEALALAHDLGHTPFGHSGEDALHACMSDWHGFDHNDQTLRVVTLLERGYCRFDGLNLSWETVEGVVKHNGPLTGPHARPGKPVPPSVEALDRVWPLDLARFSSLEAQVAALADDIAYNSADLEDGLRAGMFTLEELAGMPLIGPFVQEVQALPNSGDRRRANNEVRRRLIHLFVEDAIAETERRMAEDRIETPDDVRGNHRLLVDFSEPVRARDREIRQFLWSRMYLHHSVVRHRIQARRIVADLFGCFFGEPGALPSHWQARITQAEDRAGPAGRARIVADYIAGMTDRYAVRTHRNLFNYYD